MILTPDLIEPYYGKSVTFKAVVEAKLNSPLEARWQSIKNGRIDDIDRYQVKYHETQHLPSPQLVIDNVNFDDVGEYQLQIRISGGWCTSSRVNLRRVWGSRYYLFFFSLSPYLFWSSYSYFWSVYYRVVYRWCTFWNRLCSCRHVRDQSDMF